MISIAIPTSSRQDGEKMFTRCLNSLWDQTYQNFEVVVTDNSDDDLIQNICDSYKTGIVYYRNPIKGMAQNTNEAIRRSRGEIIKILYMDDFLIDTEALEDILKKFTSDVNWLVTGCVQVDAFGIDGHAHRPRYNDQIHTGLNTIGSPSVLSIRNKDPLFFDENLTWLLDCCYYRRLYEKYGEPAIINKPLTGIGVGPYQMTNVLSHEIKKREYDYLQEKYNK